MLSRRLLAQGAVFRYLSEMIALTGAAVDGGYELFGLSRSQTHGTVIIGTVITLFLFGSLSKIENLQINLSSLDSERIPH